MRSERVATNLTCNQGCTYCNSRRAADDRAFIDPRAVKVRIDKAISGGAKEVVLSGGEPTLRRDLAALVSHARVGGADVVVETNGTLLDNSRAKDLANAGLNLARVNVIGLVEPRDSVTRDEGGSERTVAGIRALLDADLDVELDVAIISSTLAGLAQLPARLKALFGDLKRFRGLQVRVPVESPDAVEPVSYEAAAEALASLDTQCRRLELALRLAPDSGPPPCVMGHQSRLAHLYSLTPGAATRPDHVHLEVCESCQLADRCSGLPKAYLARRAPPPMTPVENDGIRRRVSLAVSTQEQVRREFVTVTRRDGNQGVEVEKVIRVNFNCNQACRFCFVSTHLPSEPENVVRAAIRDAGAEDLYITLSGGEPTLNPDLIDYVRLARSVSTRRLTLQTNATRITDDYARELEAAGLDMAFVSLHASRAEISDSITETPGTFEKTVKGIDALAGTRIQLILNFVVCRKNAGELVPYVQLLASRWPRAIMNLSYVAPSNDVVPKETALIPRYSDALPEIARALEEARKLRVEVVGFESMCGLPLCLVPTELSRYLDASAIPEGFGGDEFVKSGPCTRCALSEKCYGIRRGYRDLYGVTELRPYSAPATAPAPPALRPG